MKQNLCSDFERHEWVNIKMQQKIAQIYLDKKKIKMNPSDYFKNKRKSRTYLTS